MTCDPQADFSDDRRYAWLAFSPIGVISCIVALYFYWKWPAIRKPPCRFLHFRFMNELVFSLCLLLSAIFETDARDNIFFWTAVTMSQAGMVFWTVNTLLDVVVISRDPFNAYRYNNRFQYMSHGLTIGVGLFMVFRWKAEFADNIESARCTARDVAEDIRYPVLVIECIGLAVSTILMIATGVRLIHGLELSETSRIRVMKQQVILTIGFAISDVMTIMPDLLPSDDYQKPFWVDYMLPIRVILDVQIFFIVTKAYQRQCNVDLARNEDTPDIKSVSSPAALANAARTSSASFCTWFSACCAFFTAAIPSSF